MRIRTAFPDDMQDPDPENNVDDDAEDDHDQQVMDDSLFPNADEGDEGKRDLPTTTEEIEDTDGAMGSAEAAAAQLAKTSDEMRLGAVAAAGGLPKVMQDKVENFNSMAKLAAAMPVGAPLVNQVWLNTDGLPSAKYLSTSPAYLSRDLANSKESAMNPIFGCKCGESQPALTHPEIDFREEFLQGHPDFLKRVAFLKAHVVDVTKDPTGADREAVHWDAMYDIRKALTPDNTRLRLSATVPALPRSGSQLRFMTFCPPLQKGTHEVSMKVTALDKDEVPIEYFQDQEVKLKVSPPEPVTAPPGVGGKRVGPGMMPPSDAVSPEQQDDHSKKAVRRFLGGGPTDPRVTKSNSKKLQSDIDKALEAGAQAGKRHGRRRPRTPPLNAPEKQPHGAQQPLPPGNAPQQQAVDAQDSGQVAGEAEDPSKRDRLKSKFRRDGGEEEQPEVEPSKRDRFKGKLGRNNGQDDDNVEEQPGAVRGMGVAGTQR